MRLILAYGSGYYPYTQKPTDYQPYRPTYFFRGPPPDAGFSYGLYEDEEAQQTWVADLGLESFSPFSGKPAKFIRPVETGDLENQYADAIKSLIDIACKFCGGHYRQTEVARQKLFCHRCGGEQ